MCASVAVVVRRFCKVALRLCSSARSCVVFWCVASRHAGHPFSLILCAIVIATVTRTCLPACWQDDLEERDALIEGAIENLGVQSRTEFTH